MPPSRGRGRFTPLTSRQRRRTLFPLPAFYLILLLCIISWTATHTTTPSWDYTTYNHPRNHPRDTYTPFPGRVLQHEHHHPHEKRNGMMAGMDLMEMLGRARGGSVAVTRPLGSVSSSSSSSSSGRRGHRIDRYGKIGDKPTTENNGGGVVGGGKKYDVVRLDDVVGEPVGGLVDVDEDGDDDDDVGGGELKRGRMVVVEDLD